MQRNQYSFEYTLGRLTQKTKVLSSELSTIARVGIAYNIGVDDQVRYNLKR